MRTNVEKGRLVDQISKEPYVPDPAGDVPYSTLAPRLTFCALSCDAVGW